MQIQSTKDLCAYAKLYAHIPELHWQLLIAVEVARHQQLSQADAVRLFAEVEAAFFELDLESMALPKRGDVLQPIEIPPDDEDEGDCSPIAWLVTPRMDNDSRHSYALLLNAGSTIQPQ